MATTFDWGKLKAEYISGEISLRELAQKYEVAFSTLGERAVREDWLSEREQFRHKTVTETLEKAQKAAVAARIDALDVLDGIVGQFMRGVDKAKVTPFDVVNALRFRETLLGRVEHRSETITQALEQDIKELGIDPDILEQAAALLVDSGRERQGDSYLNSEATKGAEGESR